MNHVLVEGRSGADSELKYTPNSTAVLNLSIAHTEKRADAFETQWFDVVVFGKYAESLANQIKKGTKVVIEGQLKSRSWQDKNNRTQKKVEIFATSIRIVAQPPKAEISTIEQLSRQKMAEEDVPF